MICSSRIWETYNWDDVTRGLLTGGPGTPLVRHIHNKAKVYVQSAYSCFACLFMFDHTVCLNLGGNLETGMTLLRFTPNTQIERLNNSPLRV